MSGVFHKMAARNELRNNHGSWPGICQLDFGYTHKPDFWVTDLPDGTLDAHTHDIILEDHAPPPAPGPANALCVKDDNIQCNK